MKQQKNKPKVHQTIPQEDYIFFNTQEDEREAKVSIGVEYRMQSKEYMGYNQDSYSSN